MNKKVKFAAVILAAGMSSRMGRPKQMLRLKGKTMLEHAITAARGAGIVSPVLVIGAFADDIMQHTELTKKCETIYNKDYTKGQATSLSVGVEAIKGKCEAAIFMLADQPLVDAALIIALMKQFKRCRPDILYPVYKEQRGNPVIVSADLFPRLINASGDQGARFLFSDSSLSVHTYDVENIAVITDIDTWDDYLKAQRLISDPAHLQED